MSTSLKQHSPKLIYLLSYAAKQLQLRLKSDAQAQLPSAAQAGVLFVLHQQDGLLMGELSERLQLVPSAISGLIQRMQDAGLILRQVCPNDGRATRIFLSAHAQLLLPQLLEKTQDLNQLLMADFSEDELKTIEKWLKFVAFDLNKNTSQD